jgi:protein tyrosine/serine phosphatase
MTKPWYASLFAFFGLACSPTVYTHGVPNLVSVDVDKNVWRSGQPTTPEAWAYIKSLGVERVVKLNFEEEGTDQGARDLGIEVVYAPIEPKGDLVSVVEAVDSAHVQLAVAALALPNTLVHCTHGQDRTGAVVGAARVVNYRWSKHQAWLEMLNNHFHWELPALMAWWLDFNGKF